MPPKPKVRKETRINRNEMMKTNDNSTAYSAIAPLYEQLAGVNYNEWAEYVLSILETHAKGKTGVDVGCGSGAFTRRFARAGYSVTGVDVSSEMLSAAAELTAREGMKITYIKQDMRSLRTAGRVHFVTALTDILNYVCGEDLKKVFCRFAASLIKGGVLIFDISTEYKIREVIGNNLFGEDGETCSYLWFNKQFEGGVEMDISLFTAVGELYEKKEEHHVQYIHTPEEIRSALFGAGFDIVREEGFQGAPVKADTERVYFVAIRR